MRELIRLLSSCLPVGKIPGIWEFIWPLLYNCLSPSLYCFHTLCQKIQTQSPISLYTHLALFVLLTATCLLFSFAALSASRTGTRPPLPLLYYIPLKLIKLIPSFTCNHVIHTFFRSFVLQPRHLLLCLLTLFKPPKWLLVTTDCMTLTPLSPLFSSHLHTTYNLTGDPLYFCASCHRLSAGESGLQLGGFWWQFTLHNHGKSGRRQKLFSNHKLHLWNIALSPHPERTYLRK